MSENVTDPTESPGNLPGAILKRCREYHGITLEEASQTTKIGISYIRSLEEDQISNFANLAYLKGFLRIYAAYLGLNADDMARMYDKRYGSKPEQAGAEKAAAESGRPARRLITLKKLMLPAVLLALILITAALFKRQPSPTLRSFQPAAAPPVVLTAPVVQPVRSSVRVKTVPPAADATTEAKTAVTGGSDRPPAARKSSDVPRSFSLKIRAIQNGSLNVAVDGSRIQSYELAVGDVIEWKAEKNVTLDAGNAGGIEVELDGKPLKQLGPSGKPVYVMLDADGVRP